MDIKKIPVGDAPESVNVIIEVSAGSTPVKYEFDKDSGAIFVDRFVHTPMHYPANYGFIPHTLSDDGDPVDVLVLAPESIIPGAVIAARPIGVLMMEDDGGMDEKVLAVPTNKMHLMYADVATHTDLPQIILDEIAHFFQHYKDLEKGKWVKITGWEGAEKAKQLIMEGVERANKG
ncbi:inorganic pyrophosphatase [Terasakiella brassicae]|uniref:Inorganic pyrophosphatase n=1 Tax=Terasakiella brassicae TaxID=1634917 RepID=A0A917BTV7_9PROT|nr:inorganic diphosphatase [Terasakiella brassicae]GGF58660.1 inorganic pyrophosphatase [Terasakiella brassicae]